MALEPGARLGPYQIVAPIATGGMGDIYGARDSRLGRDVAIKVLRQDLLHDPDRRARFEQEAIATSALNHPNILSIYDVGEVENHAYVVMELLDGMTLRERLRDGAIPLQKALEYGVQLARGLAAAHARGIAHRDLKPENLFITRDGHLKILDFGLAKVMLGGEGGETLKVQTDPGTVMGTVSYMSPEQVRGQAADHRSDIFSFGAVLYEMIAGRRAFDGPSAVESMNAILTADPPAPVVEVPPMLDGLLRRCLEKLPDERFDSARDIAYLLEGIASQRVSTQTRAAVLAQKRQVDWLRWLAHGGLVVGGIAVGMFLMALLRPRLEPPRFRYLTYSGRDSAPAVSPDGKAVAFTSDRDGRARIWLKQLPRGEEVPLTGGPDDSPRFSPDGASLLFVRNEDSRSVLYRVASVGGEPRRLLNDVVHADFSPDGRKIAYVRWRNEDSQESTIVGVIDFDGSGDHVISNIVGMRLESPRWSPDGKSIALIGSPQGGYHNSLVVLSADGKTRNGLPVADEWAELSSVVWNRSNDELLYLQRDAFWGNERIVRRSVGGGDGETIDFPHFGLHLDLSAAGNLMFDPQSPRESLQWLSLAGGPGQRGKWLARGNSTDRQPVFSPDGQKIVFISNRNGSPDLWQMNLESGGLVQLSEDQMAETDPAFSPDGQHLLWSANRSGHFEVYMSNADGSSPRQVTHTGFDAENATMTKDGQWIVFASSHQEKTGIWRVKPDGSGLKRIVAGPNYNPEVSPDGRYALYVTSVRAELSTIRVLKLDSETVLPFEIRCEIRRQNAGVIGRARWTPDGKGIVFIGQGENGANGVYWQEFAVEGDTRATRRPVAGFDGDLAASTLAVSPDGRNLVLSYWEQVASLMVAERPPFARARR